VRFKQIALSGPPTFDTSATRVRHVRLAAEGHSRTGHCRNHRLSTAVDRKGSAAHVMVVFLVSKADARSLQVTPIRRIRQEIASHSCGRRDKLKHFFHFGIELALRPVTTSVPDKSVSGATFLSDNRLKARLFHGCLGWCERPDVRDFFQTLASSTSPASQRRRGRFNVLSIDNEYRDRLITSCADRLSDDQ
jgi:hypothetical protein